MPDEVARRLARFVDEVQVKRRSPLLATPPQQKVANREAPASQGQEQTDRRSTAGTHSDLLAGRGTPQAEVGCRAAGGSGLTCIQGNIRRHSHWELDVEPGGCS
jgi:hypothetical protein